LFYVCLTAKSLRAATRPFGGNFKPRVSDGARLQRFRKTVTATTHRLFSVPVFLSRFSPSEHQDEKIMRRLPWNPVWTRADCCYRARQ
jgi:hypothetical protein